MANSGGVVLGVQSNTATRFGDYVDHTMLRAEATRRDMDGLCREAIDYAFAAVCVNGRWVSHCAEALRGSDVRVSAAIGFPLGASRPEINAMEARMALEDGAHEIDVVAPLGFMLNGEWDDARDALRQVVEAAPGRMVKVILETCLLNPAQIRKAVLISVEAGAAFVKTSTGFHPRGGATAGAVTVMRRTSQEVWIKASGGVSNCETALTMLAAGADRIGTSSGVKIAKCLDADPDPLAVLIKDPKVHLAHCRTSRVFREI